MPFNPFSWFGAPVSSTLLLPPPTEAARLRKQLTLLLGGGAFLALSVAVTRRSVYKRRIGLIPAFYHPNTRPPAIPPNGAIDAIEALNLATLNTFAFAMLMVGGGMFALNVSSVEELRARARASGDWSETQRAAEEEFEEWVVGVLARKEMKEEVKRRVEREMGQK